MANRFKWSPKQLFDALSRDGMDADMRTRIVAEAKAESEIKRAEKQQRRKDRRAGWNAEERAEHADARKERREARLAKMSPTQLQKRKDDRKERRDARKAKQAELLTIAEQAIKAGFTTGAKGAVQANTAKAKVK